VAADVKARVVGHVHSGGTRGVGGQAIVLPHAGVEADLEGELVGVVPLPAGGWELAVGARQPRAHAGVRYCLRISVHSHRDRSEEKGHRGKINGLFR
jgi:hypothetical protein